MLEADFSWQDIGCECGLYHQQPDKILGQQIHPNFLHHHLVSFTAEYIYERSTGIPHHGEMRFLTASKEDFSDLKLLFNPGFFDRLELWIKRV